ncbi:MAG: DUF2147 domain-containing protein [Solirubrobacteraceae bacterium]
MIGRGPILALTLLGSATLARGSELEGTWRSAAGTIDVKIARCGPALCGTIARVVSDRSMSDPSVSVPNAPGVGIVVLSNFLPSAPATETNTLEGYLYDREARKMYACVMSLEAPDRLSLHAYVGLQLLGRTQTWTRISE